MMSMQRSVLIVLYYYHPYVSGLTVYAKKLAENLVKRGFSVTVLATRHDRRLPRSEVINGVNVVRVPVLMKLGKGVIAPSFWLHGILLSRRVDIVNFHLPLADAGISALFIKKKKLFITYHCDLNLGKGFLPGVLQRMSYAFMQIAIRRSRTIIVNSLDYFRHSFFRAYHENAVEIHPPVESDVFAHVPHDELARRLSLDDGSVKIGFAGRIVEEKGLQYLFSSLEHLKEKFPGCIILIAGEYEKVAGGSVFEDLQHYRDRYPDAIRFTGFLEKEELVQFYSMIDVLVLPSVDPLESFGMVQVEAMLCGTPVVASDMPGVREVITATTFGALAQPGDARDLAEKIGDVLTRPPEIRRSSLDQFGLEKSIDTYVRLFSEE